ncbi:MAG: AraC family transcriptional regulator [Pseudomonadota bacterium]
MNPHVSIKRTTPIATGAPAVQISDLSRAIDLGALPGELERHAVQQGLAETPVPGVRMFRCDDPTPRSPCVYDPCVVFILQGAKRGYFGAQSFEYGASSFVVFAVPIPMEAEIIAASADEPFLGLALTIDPALIADLQMRIDEEAMPSSRMAETIAISPVDEDMGDTLNRLVATFDNERDARILGPMITREIFYRVLLGHQGTLLRAAAQRHSHYHRIGHLLKMIQDDCSVNYTTAEMASLVSMSKTSLHESFKSITAMTPLQYVKSIRLHRARLLMLSEGMSASAAAYQVGYASSSQFSREFKRLFGLPPRLDAQRDAARPVV